MTRRLLLSYIAITVVVLALLEVPLGIFYAQREEERLIADAERDAVVLASLYEDVLQQGQTPTPQPALDYAGRTGARIVVVNALGISVFDTETSPPRDFSTRPEVSLALTGVRNAGIRHSDTLDTDLLYVAVPVASGGTVHGALRSTIDADAVSRRVQRFWFGLAAVAALVLAVVVAVGWAIASTVTRPIRQLQESALRFADGALEPVVLDPDAAPEVRSLSQTLNTMAARLDQLLREQRAFVDDASHQLRTPLTAMRLRLENLQANLTDTRLVAEVDAAIVETERLGELVDALLQLARADRPQRAGPADVAAVAHERVDTWSAVAADKDIAIELRSPASAPVFVVPGALEQILDNLIDNAIAASSPSQSIEIHIIPENATTAVVVTDHGPGLSDIDKRRAVERFWRGHHVRPGTGLGLAIVHALAEASGGTLELDDAPGGGLSARVALPTAPALRHRPEHPVGGPHAGGEDSRGDAVVTR